MPLASRPKICVLLASTAAIGASPVTAQPGAKRAAGMTINNSARRRDVEGRGHADAVDMDEAQVANRAVVLSLGMVPAGEARIVPFQVKLD